MRGKISPRLIVAAAVVAFTCFGAADEPEPKRIIEFSGHRWQVKHTLPGQWGPGPNFFSDSKDNVRVDEKGRLHLQIRKNALGQWTCAEVISEESFGYGNYRFDIECLVKPLNENVVFGMFTWETNKEVNNREIDFEVSRWGEKGDENNAQFVIQPYQHKGNLKRFYAPLFDCNTSFQWIWKKDALDFFAFTSVSEIAAWSYSGGGRPEPGKEKVRLNLWLFRGNSPSDGSEVEVVVKGFSVDTN